MSGIEIAGLALGAFPVLIALLNDYRRGWEIMEDWWKIEEEWRRFQEKLDVEKVLYELNVERLLRICELDGDQIHVLIAVPGGQSWKDPSLESSLRSKFARSHTVCLQLIENISHNVERLKRGLGPRSLPLEDDVAVATVSKRQDFPLLADLTHNCRHLPKSSANRNSTSKCKK